MRGSLLLIAMLATACAESPGRGPHVPPPPMPAPPRRMDVIDQIDSARRATEAKERVYDDPKFQKRLEDSVLNARNDSVTARLIREGRKPKQ